MRKRASIVLAVTMAATPAWGEGRAFNAHETTAANETGTRGAATTNSHSTESVSSAHGTVADPTGSGNTTEVGVTNAKAGKEIYAGSAPRSGSGTQPK